MRTTCAEDRISALSWASVNETSLKLVLQVECESGVHKTTVAANVLLRANNQLLLREGHENASGQLPRALNTTSRREYPAEPHWPWSLTGVVGV